MVEKASYRIDSYLDKANSTLEMSSSMVFDDVLTKLHKQVFDLKETAFVEALKVLGWTPPPEKTKQEKQTHGND